MAPAGITTIVFDVNETLSDIGGMRQAFGDAGVRPELAPLWFTSVLRDGISLAAAGGSARFAEIGASVLAGMLHAEAQREGAGPQPELQEATKTVLAGFTELDTHPDVAEGIRSLQASGYRLITLSNGAASVARGLLGRAGLEDAVAATLSVEDAGVWKPAADAYAHAQHHCGEPAWQQLMVAVHPWDLDGAHRAGMATAWINRTAAPYPAVMSPPDVAVSSLPELAAALGPAPSAG